jgi:hypothetical protein
MEQLVLQFSRWGLDVHDLDKLLALEGQLIDALAGRAAVDGHDMGANQANIFIHTLDAEVTFAGVFTFVQRSGLLPRLEAAYREVAGEKYVRLWPKGHKAAFSIKWPPQPLKRRLSARTAYLYANRRIGQCSQHMSHSIEIVFPEKDHLYVHKVRNFAEELSRSLEPQKGWGQLSMNDADQATTYLHVRNVHSRQVSRVLAFVEALLKKHYLDEAVKVSDRT